MVIPSDLESKLHNGTIKSSFKSQVFNIPKDGICWTSLYSLFQKCFSSLSEGLFPHNIQSEFVLLLLQIAVIHVCMHTSLLWEEFFFLFPITPIRYKRLQTEASVWGLSDSQLQAKVSSASTCICVSHTYVCAYCMLQSHTCLGGILLRSPQFLTLKRAEQDTALQVQPHGFQAKANYHFSLSHQLYSYQQNPISGQQYRPKSVCLFQWSGCCPSQPTDYYCIAS